MAKQKALEDDVMDSSLKEAVVEKVSIEDMPLETFRDYRLYNEEARKLNKKLKICRYPIKQCPVDLHPKQRVIVRNNNGTTNPIKVHLSNILIHFDELLIPGKAYDLPECVVHHLTEKGNPQWGWVTLKDGSKETQELNKTPRFSVNTVWQDQ